MLSSLFRKNDNADIMPTPTLLSTSTHLSSADIIFNGSLYSMSATGVLYRREGSAWVQVAPAPYQNFNCTRFAVPSLFVRNGQIWGVFFQTIIYWNGVDAWAQRYRAASPFMYFPFYDELTDTIYASSLSSNLYRFNDNTSVYEVVATVPSGTLVGISRDSTSMLLLTSEGNSTLRTFKLYRFVNGIFTLLLSRTSRFLPKDSVVRIFVINGDYILGFGGYGPWNISTDELLSMNTSNYVAFNDDIYYTANGRYLMSFYHPMEYHGKVYGPSMVSTNATLLTDGTTLYLISNDLRLYQVHLKTTGTAISPVRFLEKRVPEGNQQVKSLRYKLKDNALRYMSRPCKGVPSPSVFAYEDNGEYVWVTFGSSTPHQTKITVVDKYGSFIRSVDGPPAKGYFCGAFKRGTRWQLFFSYSSNDPSIGSVYIESLYSDGTDYRSTIVAIVDAGAVGSARASLYDINGRMYFTVVDVYAYANFHVGYITYDHSSTFSREFFHYMNRYPCYVIDTGTDIAVIYDHHALLRVSYDIGSTYSTIEMNQTVYAFKELKTGSYIGLYGLRVDGQNVYLSKFNLASFSFKDLIQLEYMEHYPSFISMLQEHATSPLISEDHNIILAEFKDGNDSSVVVFTYGYLYIDPERYVFIRIKLDTLEATYYAVYPSHPKDLQTSYARPSPIFYDPSLSEPTFVFISNYTAQSLVNTRRVMHANALISFNHSGPIIQV